MTLRYEDAVKALADYADGKMDCSHKELWEKVFDRSLSEDEARKRYYGAVALADLHRGDVQGKTLQLIRDERAAAKQLYAKAVRFERLEDVLRKAVTEMTPLPSLSLTKLSGNKNKVGILQLSDWHYGLKINNAINRFDDAVFRERVSHVLGKVIDDISLFGLNMVYVFVQGDMISGNIHNVLRLQNQETLVEQIMNVSETLANVINELSQYVRVNVVIVAGNHERVTPKKDDNLSGESYIKLIDWFLRERLKGNERVDILRNQDIDSCYVKIFGYNIAVVHGDKDKISNAGTNLARLYNIKFDYVFTAHNHHTQYEDSGFCRVFGNASLCGVDQYAKDLRATSYAGQNFSVLHENGEIILHPIICGVKRKQATHELVFR